MRFSVIVPIYNVSGFIESGLKQLMAQTYNGDWEVLLIDDGSTDDSLAMIERASKYDHRFRVLHQTNAGAGAARNLGIDNACGEYIWFYDIDDEIEPDLLERLDKALEVADNPQMAIFGFSELDVTTGNLTTRSFEPMALNTNDEVRGIWARHLSGAHGGNNGFVWNKAYRRDFLDAKNLRFGNERIQQDEVFNLKVYAEVSTMILIADCLYRYKVYDRGNTRSRFIPDRLDIYRSVMNAFSNLIAKWDLDCPDVERWLANRFFGNVVQTMTFNCYHPDSGMTARERDKCIASIMTDSDVCRLMAYMQESGIVQSTYIGRRYARAIEHKSLSEFKLVRFLDRMNGMIRSKARKLIRR